MVYRSTVGGISVNCRWYIGQLSFEYQSCVNLSGESNGFFLWAKTSLITVIMRWGNMWQCEARLLYEANGRALRSKDMVTLFFQLVSSPIVWFLAVKQNLSQPKLNLLLLWSRSRRILKEGRVKRLLPQSRSGRIMNRKRQFMTRFKSEEYTSFIIGLCPASSRQVLVCAETTN